MRNLKSILVIVFVSVIMVSCDKDNEVVLEPVVAQKVENLPAPAVTDRTVNPPVESGEFVKFSFKTGTIVTSDDWDIAFRATKILVNGGGSIGLTDEPTRTGNASLALVSSTFSDVKEAPAESNFGQDSNGTYALPWGSGNGWYTYNGQTNIISTIAGKIIVVKTLDGNYAKMEIISYYKDLDASNPANGRYYTFNYVYNPNVGEKSFE
ncbi:HmuY family protein [Polaribacter porphyrae]|uniref:HmuY protein n=1 Tax=Polaribacter porphyrae TaxID=1137780 RepID=A0A2S7WMN8_9FLAO|nr:HmuY family protein [Polaribacter porphyrae]PQJ78572.1 hypothetical protein BTO18_04935 [Polaribacter porphyrae]